MIKAVIVHLGPARAPWVFSNLRRHFILFPKVSIVFISDQPSHLKKAKTLGCECYLYVPSCETELIFEKSTHSVSFRHNFWRTSIERLIAIQQYQHYLSEEKILHLESDVMLMPNFPWEKVAGLDSLTWLSANEFLDCAALLYSPTIQATDWLINEMKAHMELKQDATDMTLLRAIRNFNPGVISLFPSTALSIADEALRHDSARFLENTALTDYFGGIFDVTSMGMWLAGQNPRNQGGKMIRYEHYFPNDNQFDSKSFSLENGVLFVGNQNSRLVFSLHVHSKNLQLLSTKWRKELTKFVEDSSNLLNKSGFSFSGYFGSQYDIYVSVNRNFLVYFAILMKWDGFLHRFRRVVVRRSKNYPS